MNRRAFLRTAAASAAAVSLVPRHVLGGAGFVPPSETIHLALIGAGGQGRTNMQALFREPDVRIVAVADPREEADYSRFYYGGTAGRKPVQAAIEKQYAARLPGFRCAEYEDFRVLLEKEKGVDAVLCATPDHAHAAVCVRAMRLGKHVYCEKPLTHNVWEARQMARVARETGVATQMGNQGHSGEGIRATCEWIWAGAIGNVREVHGWSDAGGWAEGSGRPQDTPPVPAGFNWDVWLGPREARPYHPGYAPYNWRGWWAFGTGAIGDMACHNLDPAVWALDLRDPLTVEAHAPGVDTEVVSRCAVFTYTFAPRDGKPPVTLTWYDGGLRPPRPDELDDDDVFGGGGNGLLFVGDRGKIMCAGWGGSPVIIPQSRMDGMKRPEKTIARSKGHHRDWLDACKGGPAASARFEYGARLTELVLLGNVALRAGKKIRWDAENLRAANAPEADRFIRESCRSGWDIA
ncbi:MAG: Gfo/Idh/MocA family oxidoreductase [Verrucomicrobia bacterium]|nr:Gfo/Idh/MocA family oxidoreductase [Verrucomicrobiota bacterium]